MKLDEINYFQEGESNKLENISIQINSDLIKIIKNKELNQKDIFNELVKIHNDEKYKIAIFLNALKDNFYKLDNNLKIKIIEFLINDEIEKEIIEVFFRDIELPKLKVENQYLWDKIYKQLYGNDKNKELEIQENTLLYYLVNIINSYKGKDRPHKDKNFINKISKYINESVLNEFMNKIDYNIYTLSDEKQYNIKRTFIEIAKKNGLSTLIVNNKDFFQKSDNGFKQKILELALLEGINIEKEGSKYSYLYTFFYKIKKKSNKTSFQKELINLYYKNSNHNKNEKLIVESDNNIKNKTNIKEKLLKIKTFFIELFKKISK